MKAEIKEIPQPKKFVPFELTIKVESEQDLQKLWHRFNISAMGLSKRVENDHRHPCPAEDTGEFHIWAELDANIGNPKQF